MRKYIVALVFLLLAGMLTTVALFAWLGWWGVLVVAVVLIAVVWLGSRLAATAVRRLMTAPFKLKGKVLAAAAVEVHRITAVAPPVPASFIAHSAEGDADGDGESEDDAELAAEERLEQQTANDRRNWYEVEVTITPRNCAPSGAAAPASANTSANPATPSACDTPFTQWDPYELVLVPAAVGGADVDLDDLAGGDEVSVIQDIKLCGRDGRAEALPETLQGSNRLIFYLGLDPGPTELVWQYYLSRFGTLRVPANAHLNPPPAV